MSPLIPLLVLVPLVGAAIVLALAPAGIETVRRATLASVMASLLLTIVMVMSYNLADARGDAAGAQGASALQLKSDLSWLAGGNGSGGVRLEFGVDGLSLWLIALTGLLMLPSVLVSWTAVTERPAAFYSLMLLLQSGMVGVFAAQDIIVFYVFFEFTLIPLFFMIGLWGGADRRRAAIKFFVYTLAGSVLTFLALLAIVLCHSWMTATATGSPGALTFSIPQLTRELPVLVSIRANREFWMMVSPWIFAGLFAGFAIKVPLFPFHTWLPLAHVEAPTAGSVLLAGVLLKIGSYGFLRFALPLAPEGCWMAFQLVGWLSVIGIIYGALLALAQDDIKKLVAYSSVSHMGFCLLGLFSLNSVGITGGLLQMINHGLSTGALFAIVGMIYERYHTRDIESFSGLARKFPLLTFFLSVTVFSSIGLPGLNGFTGEILAMMGMFASSKIFGVLSLTGIILGAWYLLSLVRRTFFGRLREPIPETRGHASGSHGGHDSHAVLTDMNWREIAALTPLVACMFWIGIYPQYFISRMEPSISKVQTVLNVARLRVEESRPTQTADADVERKDREPPIKAEHQTERQTARVE